MGAVRYVPPTYTSPNRYAVKADRPVDGRPRDTRTATSARGRHPGRLVSPHRELDAVPGLELRHQAGEVGLHGAEADGELVGDLGVGAAAGHGEEDLLLPFGEGDDRLDRRRGRRGGGERRQQPGRDARGDEGVAPGGGGDRLGEQL